MKIFEISNIVYNRHAIALENLRTLDLLKHEISRYMTREIKIDNLVAEKSKGICKSITLLCLEGRTTHLNGMYCKEYVQSNRPKNSLKGAYYWPEGELEPRLKYIETHIKKLKRKVFIYKILNTILP